MATKHTLRDEMLFGQLVRERRVVLNMSQEALAAAALGNPDRKSFVSAIENNRIAKITPNTAMRFSVPLGLSREDIPASLRWPSDTEPSPIEERLRALEAKHVATNVLDDHAIARFLNTQMAAAIRHSASEAHRQRLVGGLELLRVWTGSPFSLQSLTVCCALSMLYVFAAGLGGYLRSDISVGSVRLFFGRDWAGPVVEVFLPYLGIIVLMLGVTACWFLVRPFGRSELSLPEVMARLAGIAMVSGLSCGVVDYMGIQSLAAAIIFAVISCAALSTLPPKNASMFGATGGILFGMMAAISSALTDDGLIAILISLSEGIIIGAVLGVCSGMTSSLIARRIPLLRPGQLAAAGAGIGFGSLVCLGGILVADKFAAISGGTLGVFVITWVALPLVNAGLDFLSLGVSHRLGRFLTLARARMPSIMLIMLVDLALAIGFMVGTVMAIGFALHGVTWSLNVETLSEEFLKVSASDPWGRGLWLTIMSLTTAVWTWFHFAFVVAPLAAGSLVMLLIERPTIKRIEHSRQENHFDFLLSTMITLRFVVFYGALVSMALFPFWVIWKYPETLAWIIGQGLYWSEVLIILLQ